MRPCFVCEFCGTAFEPVLDRKHPEMKIQDEFPNAPAWQREQWLPLHICSEECWNKNLGVDDS